MPIDLTATKDIKHTTIYCACGNLLLKNDSKQTKLLGFTDFPRCAECRAIIQKKKVVKIQSKKQIQYRCSVCGGIRSYGSGSMCKKCYRLKVESNIVKTLTAEQVENAVAIYDLQGIDDALGISADTLTKFFPERHDLREAYIRGIQRKIGIEKEIADKINNALSEENQTKISEVENMNEKMTVTNTQTTVEQKIVVEKTEALEIPEKITLKIEASKEQYERLLAISLKENYPIQHLLDIMLKEYIESDIDFRAGEIYDHAIKSIRTELEPLKYRNYFAVDRNELLDFIMKCLFENNETNTQLTLDDLRVDLIFWIGKKILEQTKTK